MTRSIWIVGVAAAVLLIAAGTTGYAAETDRQDPVHVGLSLAAGLLLFFSQTWFVLYLLLTGRLLVRNARRLDWHRPVELSRRFLWRTLPPAAIAIAGALALVLLGGKVLTREHSVAVHHALFWATLAAAATALRVERGVGREHEALLREMDRRLSAEG